LILLCRHISLVLINDHDSVCKCTYDNAKNQKEVLDVFDGLRY